MRSKLIPNIPRNKKGSSILQAINILCGSKKIFKIKISEIYTFEHASISSPLACQRNKNKKYITNDFFYSHQEIERNDVLDGLLDVFRDEQEGKN